MGLLRPPLFDGTLGHATIENGGTFTPENGVLRAEGPQGWLRFAGEYRDVRHGMPAGETLLDREAVSRAFTETSAVEFRRIDIEVLDSRRQ